MTIVSNPSADSEEKVERAAKILRQSGQAKQVFKFIYRNQKSFKSIKEMRIEIGGFNTRTYQAASRLAAEDIIEKKKEGNEALYGKKEFYTHSRDRILRLSENPQRLKKLPTKRKLNVNFYNGSFDFRTNPRVKLITVDEIDSFSKIKNVSIESLPDVKEMAERTINHGICKIIGAIEKKDWPGERNDIFSTRVQVKGKYIPAAFALKGKGMKGMLYPIRMGKNGDQIPRLFIGTARIYFIVHNDAIHESVYDLMQTHALQKAIETGDEVYFCIIDGKDLSRIVSAYPESFSTTTSIDIGEGN